MTTLEYILTGIVGLYTLLWVVYWAASHLDPRQETHGMHRAMTARVWVLSPLMLALAIWAGHWAPIVAAAVAVVLLIIEWAPRLFWGSKDRPAVEGGKAVTIMTYNIEVPQEPAEGELDVMRDEDPDILALQEVTEFASDYFARELDDRYPHKALYPAPDPGYKGHALFSKFPIIDETYWENEELEEHQRHLHIVLDVDGTSVHIFAVHPVPAYAPDKDVSAEEHAEEINAVLRRARDIDEPILLVGDWNMTEHYDQYKEVRREYNDVWRENHPWRFGFTWPSDSWMKVAPPMFRLDYIFHNDHWVVDEARVVSCAAESDHHPLWARMILKPGDEKAPEQESS
jgi:endonuclease/exonuclease/phosphatase (EEP) superfamily protein YafD